MKKAVLYGLLMAVGFLLVAAGNARSAPLPSQHATLSQLAMAPVHASMSERVRAQDEEEKEKQTFSGTISKSGDKYVLVVADVTYNLDDQDKAKGFADKKVKVTGTLDKDSNTIKVADIQEASDEEAG